MSIHINLLYISPDFNYTCGVSKHVFELIKHFDSRKEYDVYFVTNGGDALSKLDKHKIEYTLFSFSKGWRNIFYLAFNYFRLKSFCIEKKIDMIHTHHRYPELLSFLIAKNLNIKTITTVHSLVKGYKYLSFRSDKLIAVSNVVKTSIIDNFNIVVDKIDALYNCIYPWEKPDINSTKKLREELDINSNDFVILFLGRINRLKGIDVLIKSFRKLIATNSKIKLLIVGDVEDKTIRSLNVKQDEEIHFIEKQENVTTYFDMCNLVVLSSKFESFPYVMLEAGIVNKPFIGSRTGGIAEFIDDEVNGFLFEPGNVDDLADKIKFIINNPEKAKSAAEELNKKVKKYCNCEEYFEKLTIVYEKLLNSK
jgi:L-malate glycosyltransferase